MIGQLDDLAEIALEQLESGQFLFLVLVDGLGRDHFLRHAGLDENVVLLGDLDAGVLELDVADGGPGARLVEGEVVGLVPGKVDDVEPGDGRGAVLGLAEHAGRAVKEALEALDEDGAEGAGAHVAGDGLVAVENAVVESEEVEDVGHGVVGGDEGDVFVEAAGEVVDLEVVGLAGVVLEMVVVCFGDLGSAGGVGGGAVALCGRGAFATGAIASVAGLARRRESVHGGNESSDGVLGRSREGKRAKGGAWRRRGGGGDKRRGYLPLNRLDSRQHTTPPQNQQWLG